MPSPDISPAIVLAEIRACLFTEVMARPAPEPVTIRRDIAVLIASSLGEVIDRIDVLAEGAAAADRLLQELAIAKANIGRLETRLSVIEARDRVVPSLYRPLAKTLTERLQRRAEVVDLTEALRRERRDAGRPIGPEGGAA